MRKILRAQEEGLLRKDKVGTVKCRIYFFVYNLDAPFQCIKLCAFILDLNISLLY